MLKQDTINLLNDLANGLDVSLEREDLPEVRKTFHDAQVKHAVPDGLAVLNLVSSQDDKIATSGGPVTVRTYTPSTINNDKMVCIYIHGGGWISGNIDAYDASNRYLSVLTGIPVLAIAYSLSPEVQYPHALNECYDVICALADQYRDTDLVLMGDSAGGNLVAALCLKFRETQAVSIAKQVLLYPIVDPKNSERESRKAYASGYLLEAAALHTMVDYYLPDTTNPDHPYVSPIKAETLKGLPQTLIVSASCDILFDEGRAFYERLKSDGVPVDYFLYEHEIHGFVAFAGAIDTGEEALKDISKWIMA